MSFPKYQRRSRRNRPSDPRRPAQSPSMIYASSSRALLFNHMNVLQSIVTRGAFPFERRLFPTAMACIKAANRLSAKVLP